LRPENAPRCQRKLRPWLEAAVPRACSHALALTRARSSLDTVLRRGAWRRGAWRRGARRRGARRQELASAQAPAQRQRHERCGARWFLVHLQGPRPASPQSSPDSIGDFRFLHTQVSASEELVSAQAPTVSLPVSGLSDSESSLLTFAAPSHRCRRTRKSAKLNHCLATVGSSSPSCLEVHLLQQQLSTVPTPLPSRRATDQQPAVPLWSPRAQGRACALMIRELPSARAQLLKADRG
jgi:hypothetical protein